MFILHYIVHSNPCAVLQLTTKFQISQFQNKLPQMFKFTHIKFTQNAYTWHTKMQMYVHLVHALPCWSFPYGHFQQEIALWGMTRLEMSTDVHWGGLNSWIKGEFV